MLLVDAIVVEDIVKTELAVVVPIPTLVKKLAVLAVNSVIEAIFNAVVPNETIFARSAVPVAVMFVPVALLNKKVFIIPVKALKVVVKRLDEVALAFIKLVKLDVPVAMIEVKVAISERDIVVVPLKVKTLIPFSPIRVIVFDTSAPHSNCLVVEL
jgi:hypothetical protein